VRRFINAASINEIVFTKGATEAINPGRIIVLQQPM